MTIAPDTVPAADRDGRGLTGFGMELLLDLGHCDLAILDSRDDLVNWAGLLVEVIGMEAFGDPIAHRFGKGRLFGWTVSQLITTSNLDLITRSKIGMHAQPPEAAALINVHSCRRYDPKAAIDFCIGFFRAKSSRHLVRYRYAPDVEGHQPYIPEEGRHAGTSS